MRKVKGFTLIELLIVVVIIGILAVFVVISLMGAQRRARNTNAINSVSEVKDSLTTYFGLTNSFAGLAGGNCKAGAGGAFVDASSCGAILEGSVAKGFTTIPKDARGNPIKLQVINATDGTFSVKGGAADGKSCWYYTKPTATGGATSNLENANTQGTDPCPV